MRIVPAPAGAVGAEIHGIDPRSATAASAAEIRAAVHEHKLVIIKGDAPMSAGDYVVFGGKLGTMMVYPSDNYHHPEHPEIFVSNTFPDKTVGMARTGYYWHTDGSWDQEPFSLTMLAPQQFAGEGDRRTEYIDAERALESLDAATRELLPNMRIVHGANGFYKVRERDVLATKDLNDLDEYTFRGCPGAVHPAVITHPVTGRQSIYLGDFAMSVVGMSIAYNNRFMNHLRQQLYRPELVTSIKWNLGDVILWDNRTLLHRSGPVPKGVVAMAYRISIYDGQPFYREDISRMGLGQKDRTRRS